MFTYSNYKMEYIDCMEHIIHKIKANGLFLLSACFISACSDNENAVVKVPAPAVSVYQVSSQPIGHYREFVARTQASKEVSLKARVEGELIERLFEEGGKVTKDQILLKIDPAPYQSKLNSAKADLKSKISAAQGSARDLERGKKIAKDGYISKADLDKLTTNSEQADEAVNVAKAALENAQLNLDYTVISAPYSGEIGKVNFDLGSVVGPASGSLAELIATDPMYVNFQVAESDFITYKKNNNNLTNLADLKIDIWLRLPNNEIYPHHGELNFTDTKISQGLGTVEIRATFPNPENSLLPGLYVTLVVESDEKEIKAFIPQAAVQENQLGKFVLVVKDNKVIQRPVVLGRRVNAMWVVEQGLENNEQIIIEGLQKVKPGIEVTPVVKVVDTVTGIISDNKVN